VITTEPFNARMFATFTTLPPIDPCMLERAASP
jgi:hypothetical protein